ILAQAYRDFELIIVDQTPQHEPETDAFLRAHADHLKLIRLEVANLPNARNCGIEVAWGDIVVCVDDDIRLGPKLLGQLVTHFADPAVDAIAPVVVDNRGLEVAMAEYCRKYNRKIESRTGPLLPAREVIGACMAIRRSVILDIGGFDARLGEL